MGNICLVGSWICQVYVLWKQCEAPIGHKIESWTYLESNKLGQTFLLAANKTLPSNQILPPFGKLSI